MVASHVNPDRCVGCIHLRNGMAVMNPDTILAKDLILTGYITQQAVELDASLYPDCPLCGWDIVRCPCDPDLSAEAIWQEFQNAK